MPLKLAAGVKVMLPSTSSTEPLVALVASVTLSVSPSASLSLARSDAAVMPTPVSSSVVALSATATGASLTGVTVMVTSPASVAKPSETVYSKLAGPL